MIIIATTAQRASKMRGVCATHQLLILMTSHSKRKIFRPSACEMISTFEVLLTYASWIYVNQQVHHTATLWFRRLLDTKSVKYT